VDELLELREYIERGDYLEALTLIGEMEEMSREDKINKVGSLMEILILHLIKQYAEQRSTRSWDVSIKNAVENIIDINKRRKAGGYYLSQGELKETIDSRYQRALRRASLEALEGRFDEFELAQKIDEAQIKQEALQLILEAKL
jgi:hypothetical protein